MNRLDVGLHVVLDDGCAAFDRPTHETAFAALTPVERIATIAQSLPEIAR